MQHTVIKHAGREVPLYVHDNEYISNVIRSSESFFELPILDWLGRSFPHHKTIVDVGANIGNHAVFFKEFLTFDRLICFEPFPPNLDLLKLNLGSRAEYHQVALSSHEGKCGLRYRPDNLGMVSIDESIPGETPLKTLDSYQFNDVTLLKIDVEEHHTETLKGCRETLKRCQPVALLEGNFDELFPIIADLQYVCIALWQRYATYCFVPISILRK